MKKGRGPPDHRLGERALSLSLFRFPFNSFNTPPSFLRRSCCGATSLRASSPIWVSEMSLARTRERGGRTHVLARLASLAQIGEFARRLWRHSPLPERLEQANPFASCVLVRELRKKDLFCELVAHLDGVCSGEGKGDLIARSR